MTDIYDRIAIITKDGRIDSLPYESAVLALGTFDGVHIAHQKLLSCAEALKSSLSADAVGAWCFEESPHSLLSGNGSLTLTENSDKIRLLLDHGADFVISAKFEDFRSIEAELFVREVLISGLKCIGTVCGYNHRFGRGGLGSSELLKSIFGKKSAVTVPEVRLGDETVSSTAIREHIKLGEIELASKMLSRPLSFSSVVESGKKLGRRLGFPTANQKLPSGLFGLKRGVYATRCIFEDGQAYIGVSNIGVRPSIESGDDHTLNSETYLIGFSGELYGRSLRIELHSFLREEKKFSSLDELSAAIENDKRQTIRFFQSTLN